MRTKINYTNLFGFLVGLGFLSVTILLSIKTLQNDSANFIGQIIVLFGFSFLGYLFISTAICRFQYDKLENKRKVQVDINNKHLRIINSEHNYVVLNRDNVDAVELYYSWNTNPFSSDLGFSKIFLKDDSIEYITQCEIPQSEVKQIFGRIATEKKSKFKHYIK
jgi:hypothetical protein